MKKQLYIVGGGMGKGTLSCEGKRRLKEAQVIFDPAHLTQQLPGLSARIVFSAAAQDIADIMDAGSKSRFVLLLPGDPSFFSQAEEISKKLPQTEIIYVAGVSQAAYFFAKCRLPMQDAAMADARSRPVPLVDLVRRNPLTLVLTRKNLRRLALELCDGGYEGLMVWVGENLGTKKERLYKARPIALCVQECAEDAVILIENPDYDRCIGYGSAPRLRASSRIPELCQPLRATVLSNLMLRENSVCWCIGDCACAMAQEIALLAHRGSVYAYGAQGLVDIIMCDCAKCHMGNLFCRPFTEESDFSALPPAQCILIGGSNLDYDDILEKVTACSPDARLVITSSLPLDSEKAALCLNSLGRQADICQLLVSQVTKKDGRNITTVGELVYIIISSQCAAQADEPLPLLQEAL